MEKAHGWVYVRSKNNGKASKQPQNGQTPPTPQMSTPGSYHFDVATPDFPEGPAYGVTAPNYRAESLAGSTVPSESPNHFMDDHATDFNETFAPFDPTYAWNESNDSFVSGNMTGYAAGSHQPSWDAADMTHASSAPSAFEASLPPHDDETLFNENYDWSNMEHDMTSMNIQLITPATSVEMRPYNAFNRHPTVSFDQPLSVQNPSLSPGAKGDAMLYSPYSMQSNEMSGEEGYEEFTQELQKPTHDFSLFSSSSGPSSSYNTTSGAMFQDLSAFHGPSAWSGRSTELAQQMGLGDLMQMDE